MQTAKENAIKLKVRLHVFTIVCTMRRMRRFRAPLLISSTGQCSELSLIIDLIWFDYNDIIIFS